MRVNLVFVPDAGLHRVQGNNYQGQGQVAMG